ncbi:Uncharacterised protein [Vibrio cholerae]|nr:Uncharacterised protein [Vibrio cholerae]
MLREPNGGFDCTIGKRHSVSGFVGDLHSLTNIGKHGGMLTNDVSRTNRGKPNFIA